MEGARPSSYIANMLTELLGTEILPEPPLLDRCHRASWPGRSTGDVPKSRALLVKFHYYTAKEKVLEVARGKVYEYQGYRTRFRPDYPKEVAKDRAAFYTVKTELFKREVNFFPNIQQR
ncbi:hypothetical protein AAFF_G00091020 [Aldrovandia affinis]|uniref:Uncharacterized protein n=1 Tax=Aldrovandia affinis TaxID=143900 RepID=A0AAD7RW16_9TELE|nr:hypothetical protein AAFF_G00091020 [Aldrovandia affinis]